MKVSALPICLQDYTEGLPLTQTPVQFLQHTGDREEINTIQLHLASLNFTYSEMHHPISELSGGQQGKLFLLQLVLTSPQFLLLDEPTRNFSPTSQPEIRRLFADYPGGLVTVSHDRTFLKEVCKKIYRLTENGFREIRVRSKRKKDWQKPIFYIENKVLLETFLR